MSVDNTLYILQLSCCTLHPDRISGCYYHHRLVLRASSTFHNFTISQSQLLYSSSFPYDVLFLSSSASTVLVRSFHGAPCDHQTSNEFRFFKHDESKAIATHLSDQASDIVWRFYTAPNIGKRLNV